MAQPRLADLPGVQTSLWTGVDSLTSRTRTCNLYKRWNQRGKQLPSPFLSQLVDIKGKHAPSEKQQGLQSSLRIPLQRSKRRLTGD